MYTNYSYPINSSISSMSSIPSMRSSSSYSSYSMPYSSNLSSDNSSNRIIGGFAFPFLLGGVTGAAIAPNFWRPPYYGRPPYAPYPPYYPYYPRPY